MCDSFLFFFQNRSEVTLKHDPVNKPGFGGGAPNKLKSVTVGWVKFASSHAGGMDLSL